MKQFLLYLSLLLLASSCYDDLGNYDYTELNDVTIDSISTQWYEKYSYADTLKIEPVLHLALGGSEDHLKFEWKLMPLHAQYNKDSIPADVQRAGYTIGKEKNLSYPLMEKPGEYAGFFYVKDTLTGISYKTDFYVKLRTAVSEGWMLLCEEAGKARMDVISYTSENEKLVSHNIWKDLDMELGKPYKLTYNYNKEYTSRLAYCEAGTFNLDPETLQPSEENNMLWQFSENPDKIEIVGGITMHNSDPKREIVVTSEGELYWRKYDDLIHGIQFTFPVNKLGKSTEYFKVSPHIGYKPHWSWPQSWSVILYDETNRRFLALESKGIGEDRWGDMVYEAYDYPNVLDFIGGTADYDVVTGKDLVHMEGNKEGYVFAVLKTPGTEDYDIYGMLTHSDYKTERTHYMRLRPANSDKIIHFAFHPLFRMLYYATDQGDVYQFNLTTPEEKARKILSFPGEHITVMKFQYPVPYILYADWEKAREYWLYIAGYDTTQEESTSGIFRMYDFPQQTSTPVLKQKIDQLGKIVDIAYRYKNDYQK